MKSLIWRSFLQYINVHDQGIKILNNFFKEILEGQSFSKIKQQTLMSKFDCYIILFLTAFAKTQCCQYFAEFQQTQEKQRQKEAGRPRGGETWNWERSEKPGKLHKVFSCTELEFNYMYVSNNTREELVIKNPLYFFV